MPSHRDRRDRKTLLRDLFAELPPERQAVELEILGEIARLARKAYVNSPEIPPAPGGALSPIGGDPGAGQAR